MPASIILTEEAEKDLDDAYQWYEEQETGLGKEFIRCIDTKIAEIKRFPLHHQVVQSEQVRRALIKRFPFSIYFVKEKALITILTILHQKKRPDFWKSGI